MSSIFLLRSWWSTILIYFRLSAGEKLVAKFDKYADFRDILEDDFREEILATLKVYFSMIDI